jgi:hypothetical protein
MINNKKEIRRIITGGAKDFIKVERVVFTEKGINEVIRRIERLFIKMVKKDREAIYKQVKDIYESSSRPLGDILKHLSRLNQSKSKEVRK